jgi:hypothetical protein
MTSNLDYFMIGLQIQQRVLTVQQVGCRIKVASSANLVKQERLVMSPVPIVKIAMLVNTVKVKKKTLTVILQKIPIQRHVLIVQLVGCPDKEAPSVNAARQVKKAAKMENRDALSVPCTSIVKVTKEIVLVNFFQNNQQIPRLVLIVRRVGDQKRVAASAKVARPASTPTPYWIQRTTKSALVVPQASIAKVKRTMVSPIQIQRRVLIAQRGIHQVLVVPSAKSVGQGHMVMGVSLVPRVNTATAVTPLRSLAEIAQPVTTVTTLAKVLVCPVFQ